MKRTSPIYFLLIAALLLLPLFSPRIALAVCGEVKGFWQFENNLTDSSGCANHGSGTVQYTAGRFGSGLVRDGLALPVTLPNASGSLTITSGQITLEGWVKTNITSLNFQHVIDNYQSYTLAVKDGRIAAMLRGPGNWWTPTNVPTLSLGQWYYLAATYNGNVETLYVDGVQVASRAATGAIPTGAAQVALGGVGYGGGSYLFNGTLDNVRVTNRALSTAEIAANYNAGRVFLPLIANRFPAPPKSWTGMHLGNRNTGDWNATMLAPFDPTLGSGGAWPQIVVALSRQVFTVNRDAKCKITASTISILNNNLYSYLKRAAQAGTTAVMIRIYPSPGNFAESIDPAWPDPLTRPSGRTLLTSVGQRPGGWSQCNNDGRFRTVDDIGDEMLAIQRFVNNDGWQVYGFEPANEPNVEWYSNPSPPNGNEPSPSLAEQVAWSDMDYYFSTIYYYVQSEKGSTSIRVFTPPMSQGANAEMANVRSLTTPCQAFDFSGYEVMSATFNSTQPANDGYSWHNYFLQSKEQWADCPNGMHVSMWFPEYMTSNIINGFRDAFITEADLAPPQFNWNNSVTDKDTQATAATNSIRDFLDYERNASSNWGARRIAVWLLHDDTGNQQHMWAQAWNGTAFRQWFNEWWYQQEPHIP
jgi:hypothetical protein